MNKFVLQHYEFTRFAPDTLAEVQNVLTTLPNAQPLALVGLDLTIFDQGLLTRIFGHFSELT